MDSLGCNPEDFITFLDDVIERKPQMANGKVRYAFSGSIATNLLAIAGNYNGFNGSSYKITPHPELVRKVGDFDVISLGGTSKNQQQALGVLPISDLKKGGEVIKDADKSYGIKFDTVEGEDEHDMGVVELGSKKYIVQDPKEILLSKVLTMIHYPKDNYRTVKQAKDVDRLEPIYTQLFKEDMVSLFKEKISSSSSSHHDNYSFLPKRIQEPLRKFVYENSNPKMM